MKIITIASLKGGCGKTSLAAFLAQAISYQGGRVLAVDLDHNNNLTDYFCRDLTPENLEQKNAYHLVRGEYNPYRVIRGIALGLDFIPTTPTIARIDAELIHDPGATMRFRTRLLSEKEKYDFVIIDTPPALTLPLNVGIYAADLILCPVNLTRWTLQGLGLLEQTVELARETTGRALDVLAVPSIVTEKEALAMGLIDTWNLTETAILKQAAVRNAGTNGSALKGQTKAWEQFNALAREVMK